MAFVTWDAATVTAVTLSSGNLVASNTGTTSADQGARVAAASGKTSGKHYFEIAWTTILGGANFGIGVGTVASTYTSMGSGGTTGVIMYKSGSIWSQGSNVSVGLGTWASGQVAGIAVDLDNRSIWFRFPPAGNWNASGTANPATNTGGFAVPAGTMVPFVTFGGTGGVANNVVTANFGASTFVGAIPSGFVAFDPPIDTPAAAVVGGYTGGGPGWSRWAAEQKAKRRAQRRALGLPDDEEDEEYDPLDEYFKQEQATTLRIGRQGYKG